MIKLLSKETIDKIAAGEVVERPENVVKELLDNAVDSGATSISVEIKGGGSELIRVTDNGSGIEKADVRNAFLRHATSKLTEAGDLLRLTTMGFRGEALSSIAGVSRVELITRCEKDLTGTRYLIEGGKEISFREVGVPVGTTMIVRDLFFNVPVRKDFLKSPKTEGSYVRDMVEKCALSFPEISFSFLSDGRQVFHTTGSGKLKDVIYVIYGAEITKELIPVTYRTEDLFLEGFISKPVISRSKRDYEIYFVNRRYVRSQVMDRAIETAYDGYLMQHRFPFTVLSLHTDPGKIDVNIHPKKTEIRFSDDERIFQFLYESLVDALRHREHIVEYSGGEKKGKKEEVPSVHVEPFERKNTASQDAALLPEFKKALSEIPMGRETAQESSFSCPHTLSDVIHYREEEKHIPDPAAFGKEPRGKEPENVQETLPLSFLSEKAKPYYRFIGQIFDTYWMIEYNHELFIIDQHAAHEKVNYERFMREIETEEVMSQEILPMMITVSAKEAALLGDALEAFSAMGYDIESAGDKDFIVRAVPACLPEISRKEMLLEMIAGLCEEKLPQKPRILKERIASMSCKAAVKGGNTLSEMEMRSLLDELLTLKDPYTCPHGRPTIVRFSKAELDKMFKRIV